MTKEVRAASKRIEEVAFLKKKSLLARFDMFFFLCLYAVLAFFFFQLLTDALANRMSPEDLLALQANTTAEEVTVEAGNVDFENSDDDLDMASRPGVLKLVVLDPAFHALFVFSIGVLVSVALHVALVLLQYWNLPVKRRMLYRAAGPDDATAVYLKPTATGGKVTILPYSAVTKSFEWIRRPFKYSTSDKTFHKLSFPTGKTVGEYTAAMADGLSRKEVKHAQTRYGSNGLDVPLPSFLTLYKEHAASPFFVFQIFCSLLWILDDYGMFSFFTLAMLVGMEGFQVIQRIKTMREIKTMVPKPIMVHVRRESAWAAVPSDKLVPGDVISIPTRSRPATKRASKKGGKTDPTIVCADLLLLDGTAVLDEAMLTGESVPQLREPCRELDAVVHTMKTLRGSVMFAGTTVLQVEAAKTATPNDGAIGFVLRTGFETAQGKLVRSVGWDTDRLTGNIFDSLVFIFSLLVVAIVAAIYTFQRGMAERVASLPKLLLTALLIITSVVPPELPMQLTLAVNTAMGALKKKGIYCTESFRIPLAGTLTAACFDKTGTLTTDALNLTGIVTDTATRKVHAVSATPGAMLTRTVLAGCHTLFRADGELQGDPMEAEGFKAAGAVITAPGKITVAGAGLEIIQRFQFNSTVKRMTTIARTKEGTLGLTKGAPEVIKDLLRRVPAGYDAAVTQLARDGYRVIALAHHPKPPRSPTRATVEKDLVFDGLAVFKAPVREDAPAMVQQLLESAHRVLMITGDNILTALSVAREVGMITHPTLTLDSVKGDQATFVDEAGDATIVTVDNAREVADTHTLAAEGAAVGALLAAPDALQLRVVPRVSVYARTTPAHKSLIVAALQRAGHSTLMTGDGTNDVGALKRADVGVAIVNRHITEASIAEAEKRKAAIQVRMENTPAFLQKRLQQMQDMQEELTGEVKIGDASIAAPFTLRKGGLSAVLEVCRQGRATLLLTVMMYKTLALECLVRAYSLSVLTLDGVRYSTAQLMAQQMFQTALMVSQNKATPLDRLSPRRAPRRAVTAPAVISTVGQGALHMAVLWLSARLARQYSGPAKTFSLDHEFEPGLVNTVVFMSDCVIMVSIAFANYVGNPFMLGLWKNKKVRNTLGLAVIGLVVLMTATQPEINKLLEMVEMPETLVHALSMLYIADIVIAKALDVACSRFIGSSRIIGE